MKKDKKNKDFSSPSFDRVLFLTFPMGVSFIILIVLEEISFNASVLGFSITFLLTFFVARPFFKELEKLIRYLKSEALEEKDIQIPLFYYGRREILKIFNSFNQIKTSWSIKNKLLEAQTLSDSAILENLPIALILLNEQSVIVQANLTSRQWLGGNILMQPCSDVFKTPSFLEKIEDVIYKKTEKKITELKYQYKNKKKYFQVLIEQLPSRAKNKAVAVLVFQDISAFKTLEKTQTAFFANASHELKTPLSVLSGCIETLQGPAQHDISAQKQFFPIIIAQIQHMTELIQNLLSLSKWELNKENIKKENVLLYETIHSVIQCLQPKAKEKGQKISIQTNGAFPPIQGNNQDFFRVFQNLIDNALKYGKKHSTISITIEWESLSCIKNFTPQKIKINIHNEGNPISPGDIPHLTERFFRGASKNVSGTGLGLSIVEEIINYYDGSLLIESSKTLGTTFSVILPV